MLQTADTADIEPIPPGSFSFLARHHLASAYFKINPSYGTNILPVQPLLRPIGPVPSMPGVPAAGILILVFLGSVSELVWQLVFKALQLYRLSDWIEQILKQIFHWLGLLTGGKELVPSANSAKH